MAKSQRAPEAAKKIVFQMLKIARGPLTGGNGKRVTVKAMPTPLTRMAARGFDVTHTKEKPTESRTTPRGGAGCREDWRAGVNKYLLNANYF